MTSEQKSPEEEANSSTRAYFVAATFWKLDKKYTDLPEELKIQINKQFMQQYITTSQQNGPQENYLNEEQVLLLLTFVDLLLAQLAPCDTVVPMEAFMSYCRSNVAKENELFIKDGNVTAPVTEATKNYSLEEKENFQQIVEYFMRHEKALVPDVVQTKEEPTFVIPTQETEQFEDATGLQQKDIEMVAALKKVGRNEAVRLLKQNNGEIMKILEENNDKKEESSAVKSDAEKPEENNYFPPEKDIALVIDQTGASRETAVAALQKTNGDIVHAIMEVI